MDSPDVALLVDMGFPKNRAIKALNVTGNKGVEPAMEWLLAHADEFMNEEESASVETGSSMETSSVASAGPGSSSSEAATADAIPGPSTSEADTGGGGPPEARSLKCNECDKLFRSTSEMEYHAAKTGHSQFSESTEEKKPLTEEEKQLQMRLLEEKMKMKRREREEREKQEELERERNRIRTGKEMSAAKKKLEDDEMKKVIDAKKREKEEERLARQRVRDQIEADKAARRAKAAEASKPPGEAARPLEQASTPSLATPPTQPLPQKDYNQTRLQIRLMNGNALTQTFSSKEQLSAVRLYVEMNRTDGDQPFCFMTSFPRKIFSPDDYEKPLDVLGLVPSAVLILVKPQ